MDRWMGSSRKPSEPIRTAFIDLLVRNRVIRVYEIKGGGGGREGEREKKKKKKKEKRTETEAWRVVEAQRKIDAYLWDTFSKQVIFAGGRGYYI